MNFRGYSLLKKGQKLRDSGKILEALSCFQELLELHPEYEFGHLHKGLTYSALNDYDNAVSSLDTAIKFNSKNSVLPFFLGVIHFDHKQYVSAIQCFEQSLNLDSSHKASSAFIGLCHLVETNFESGISSIKEYKPQSSIIESRMLLNCGKFIMNHTEQPVFTDFIPWSDVGIFDEPESPINWHIKLFQSKAGKHYFKGNNELKNGKRENALADFFRALKVDKNMNEARKQILQIYLDKAEHEKALKVTEEFPADFKASLEYSYLKGIILFNLKKYEEAENILKVGFNKVGGKDFLFPYCLGLCSIAMKEEIKALQYFDKAVNLIHPDVAGQQLNKIDDLIKERLTKH